RTLADLLVNKLAEVPDRIAVIHGDCALSYRDLIARVYRLAGALDATLDETGTQIGILLDNSPEFLIAYLAAAVSGRVAVPLNTHLQTVESTRLLSHC